MSFVLGERNRKEAHLSMTFPVLTTSSSHRPEIQELELALYWFWRDTRSRRETDRARPWWLGELCSMMDWQSERFFIFTEFSERGYIQVVLEHRSYSFCFWTCVSLAFAQLLVVETQLLSFLLLFLLRTLYSFFSKAYTYF